MALSTDDKYLLDYKMGKIANKVGLGSLVLKAAGSFTTAGGDAAETITVSGITASDVAIVGVKTAGGTPRTIVAAAAASGQINVTMSGDPSTDHVLYYMVASAF